MGLLELKRLISMHRRRRQIQARHKSLASWNKRGGSPCEQDHVADGSITSQRKRKGSPCEQECATDGSVASLADRKGSSCQPDNNSQSGETKGYSGQDLSEFQLSSMLVRTGHLASYTLSNGTARFHLQDFTSISSAACVSRAFRCSWRRYPNLILSEETLGLKRNAHRKDFTCKVDHIMKKHSGIGLKRLKIYDARDYNAKVRCCLDSWLQIAITPRIEELSLRLNSDHYNYKFPCPLLWDGNGDSIRDLQLYRCTFRPTVELGPLRSLTILDLCMVRITGDELGCLLSNSFALERLQVRYCSEITCVKIPCLLQRLSYLQVITCYKLQVLESKAPNLSSFTFVGDRKKVQLLLRESLQLKNLDMRFAGSVSYTRAEIASIMPNIVTLDISSEMEVVNTPIVSCKFLHLKYLSIRLTGVMFSPGYDYFSLVSFLDASPSLETFKLSMLSQRTKQVSVFEDPRGLRQLPEQNHHGKLRKVSITGFSSEKSLVELARHVLASAASLEWLALDTTEGCRWLGGCTADKAGRCFSMEKDAVLEAHRALCAVQVYIKPRVPSTVNLHVLGPCSQCHGAELLTRDRRCKGVLALLVNP